MTTKEVAQICGVSSIATITENAKKVGIVLENGKAHNWTDDEVKKIQMQLVKNTTLRGNATTSGKVVEEAAFNALKGGLSLQVIMQSGNIEACKELCQMITEGTKAQHDLLLAQEQNKLLLEQNEQIKKDALTIAGWAEQRSVLAYSIAHHLNWNLSKRKAVGKQLATIARTFNHNVGKITDRDFGEVNAYGVDTWALWESKFRNKS